MDGGSLQEDNEGVLVLPLGHCNQDLPALVSPPGGCPPALPPEAPKGVLSSLGQAVLLFLGGADATLLHVCCGCGVGAQNTRSLIFERVVLFLPSLNF